MRTTVLLFLFGSAFMASAQNANKKTGFQGTLGGDIGMSIPTGDFDLTWGANMFQVGAHVGIPFRRIPVVQGGIAFGYSVMGRTDKTVPITTDYVGITEGTLTTRCKVFSYHPLLRFSPLQGRVRPYVDGMAGLRQFSTTSRVHADGVEGNISKERNETDFAFSAGWAAGVMVTLGEVAYAELRVERFNSGKATFVDPESVTVSDQGTVGFNTLTSNTDVTNVLLGIGVRF